MLARITHCALSRRRQERTNEGTNAWLRLIIMRSHASQPGVPHRFLHRHLYCTCDLSLARIDISTRVFLSIAEDDENAFGSILVFKWVIDLLITCFYHLYVRLLLKYTRLEIQEKRIISIRYKEKDIIKENVIMLDFSISVLAVIKKIQDSIL